MEPTPPANAIQPSPRWYQTKKGRIALGVAVTALVVGGVTGALMTANRITPSIPLLAGTPQGTATPSPAAPTPTPKLTERLLDGQLVPEGDEKLRPLGVMIENLTDARPQKGLSQANWVYEAQAEGGITRFLALFANPRNAEITVGPIRSVRPYFLDYAREFNSFFAHVGGNATALDSIAKDGGVYDLNQFAVGAPTFARDFSRKVAVEHTMYSTTTKLVDYAVGRGAENSATFAPLVFSDAAAEGERGASGRAVRIDFSAPAYLVHWDYDASTNSYSRTMAGTPHVDGNDGIPITAKNLIIQSVVRTTHTTRINEHGWLFTLKGSGPVTILKNGTSVKGTWKREGNGRTRYYAADGTEIPLVRGTTWVEVIHADTTVTL